MTTIAARVAGDKVKIAWDAQVTYGSRAEYGINKVVKINDQFAVGIAGVLRYANIVHRASVNKVHPFDLKQSDFDGYAYLLDEVIPEWMKAVKKEKANLPDEESEIPWGVALVALGGKIYSIGHDFSVSPVEDYAALGSGGSFAMTALHLGKTAKQAVEIASQLDIFTGGTIKEMTV